MKDYLEAERQDLKRRRRERYLIIFLCVLISFLIYLGMRVFHLGQALPFSTSIIAFALINLNVILLLLLLFLTVRNLVKLLFERKKSIMGAKLRTKLVLAFVSLSLLPTVILFFVSVQFISSSIEYWFSLQIEQSLKNSLEVGQDHYKGITDEILAFGNNLGRVITYEGFMIPSKKEKLEKVVDDKRKEFGLASLQVFSKELGLQAVAKDHRIDLSTFKVLESDILKKTVEKGMDSQHIQSSPHGDLVNGIVPIFSRTESKAVVGFIILAKFVPGAFVNRLQVISRGLQEYRQLKMLKTPIVASHIITLSIVTLLIIFSSVWFGFYLSKEITVPIKELAEGTNRIAMGDYDFFIDLETKDEVGMLVNSFNKMTMDLKTSKDKLEEANKELMSSNLELEQRRLYMEIVLANVAAGVVSADAGGNILTINKSAERMLDIKAEEIIGKNYREVLYDDYRKIIDDFLGDEGLFRKGYMDRQVRLSANNQRLTLLVSLNVLRDDRGRYLGLVAVLEDLSEIEKAQRMAAWREVARRIAHEVKNPLTPIQLSAQRLKKRYGEILEGEDAEIFSECTGMIITQVEELKRLVNEFSNFARMPTANPAPSDIRKIINEALSLYKEAHKDVKFEFKDSEDVPVFNLDKEQIRRVMINLFDNAIEAIDGKGKVMVSLKYDNILKMVRIEVADNGRGISPENKSRLFEPYFSTKKQGTGLGLAIVSTIITDHNGFIRVKDNKPKGTQFIIELPARI
ncbi:MAG: PAS domain S-box protein [Proteobacteria bacterium]|nr:PAS domain S-box protein [Desulfobacterales bacterium]MBL6967366.1 PAS domain S-box protein [Desulfobacteraceae bacterium]MBU0733351.1 PAS domain S-box protein [Pseudomonadota bacterium]MBL7101349.1 PAS domain S-box protein [Desulfobacteraceae bacterium]MBL7171595.1 PAS domain S-box protein [Desulfobacteraceae bacterium]